ncbi:hypothetical protein NDJ22_00045 [Vibrio alginolyticus]|uniref:hypothetical protein n=1 Tax=Vibrio alginolyticus TaxID=663 RepID=UPI00215E86DA|nr:hypothetical protein [Vibrio alginolyticus]MCS0263403.1 hypothetical protein [Vibrio alginolyticus]
MAINVDVQISPQGAVQGGRVAETSLDRVGKAADVTTARVDKTSKALEVLPAKVVALDKETQKVTKTTGSMNQVMGQAGYQIADFASQVQYGGNVLGAFGVQAGQLLSVVNPMAGGLLTVAGIVGGQYLMSTNEAAEATKTLTERTLDYTKAAENLTRSQASFALAETTKTLSEQQSELTKVTAKIETYTANLARYPGSAKAEEWNSALVENRANLDTLNQEIAKNIELKTLYSNAVNGVVTADEDATKAIADQATQVQILRLQQKGLNEEAYILAGVQRLGANATAEQVTQYKALLRAEFELTQQQKTLNAGVKAYDQDGAYIQRLKEQAAMVGLTAREQAALTAEQRLSDTATAAQIAQARELATVLYDQAEAQKAAKQAQREEQRMGDEATAFSVGLVDSSTGLTALEEQRQRVLEYQEQELGDQEAHAAALVAIDKKTMQERANIASSGLGSLLSLTQGFAGESSGIYRSLLAVQKAATLTSVLYSSYDAIGKAWSSAAFPANLGNVALATVETGALQAAVEAVTPAFATGGMAYGPGTGTSDSFTARISNGEFIMPAQQTRRYYSDLESMRSGNYSRGSSMPAKIVIENKTTGRIDNVQQSITEEEVRLIISEELPTQMAEQISDEYSPANSALKSSYVLQRNL